MLLTDVTFPSQDACPSNFNSHLRGTRNMKEANKHTHIKKEEKKKKESERARAHARERERKRRRKQRPKKKKNFGGTYRPKKNLEESKLGKLEM